MVIVLLCALLFSPFFVESKQFEITPRIHEGNDAEPNQFPYMASLRQVKRDGDRVKYNLFCGAAVINDRWVISAAHCFHGERLNVSNVRLFVGANTMRESQMYEIKTIIQHKHFDKVLKSNDISLVKTDSKLIFNEKIQPISMSSKWIDSEHDGLFAGYGLTELNLVPLTLKYANLRVITNEECIQLHTYRDRYLIHDSVLCTFIEGGKGPCRGDSGGVLVVNHQLVGILSWGIPCSIEKPHQFTRISSFIDWIQQHTGIHAI